MRKHVLQALFGTMFLAVLCVVTDAAYGQGQAKRPGAPYRIYAITYRGITEVTMR